MQASAYLYVAMQAKPSFAVSALLIYTAPLLDIQLSSQRAKQPGWAAQVPNLPTPVSTGQAVSVLLFSLFIPPLTLASQPHKAPPQHTNLIMRRKGARKTTLTALSNDILKDIIVQTVGEDLRAWCRLATTCKRLWTLQLPCSVHIRGLDVNPQRKKPSVRLLKRAREWLLHEMRTFQRLTLVHAAY